MSTNDDYCDRLNSIREKYGCSQPKKSPTLHQLEIRKSIQVPFVSTRPNSAMKTSGHYGTSTKLTSDYSVRGISTTAAKRYDNLTTERFDKNDKYGKNDKYEKYDKYSKYDKYDNYDKRNILDNLSPKTSTQLQNRISFGQPGQSYSKGYHGTQQTATPNYQTEYPRKFDLNREIEKIRENYSMNRKKVVDDYQSKYTMKDYHNLSYTNGTQLDKQRNFDKHHDLSGHKVLEMDSKFDTFASSKKTYPHIDYDNKRTTTGIDYKDYKDYKEYKDSHQQSISPIKRMGNITSANDDLYRKNPITSSNRSSKDLYTISISKEKDSLLYGKSSNIPTDKFWRERQAKLSEFTANRLNQQKFSKQDQIYKLKKSNSKRSGIYDAPSSISKNASYDSPMKRLPKKYDDNAENTSYKKSDKLYSVTNIDSIQNRIQSLLGR